MVVFKEIDPKLFEMKIQSYSNLFTPFVAQMKTVVDKHPDISEYRVFNDYINIVQWPIRKLEYSYVLDQIVGKSNADYKILDAGCGVTPVPFLLGTISNHVHAVDFSSDDIKLMQTIKEKNDFPGSQNVKFEVQDITNLSFEDNVFDCVSCVSVLEHIDFPYYMQAISELYRVLKPGGTLVCTMDFWLGASRKTTISSGGFSAEDITQITSIFKMQMDQSGLENIKHLQKEDIEAFWTTHYDASLEFAIREYIAVGFTITKHSDPKVVSNTIEKLKQYQIDQAYSVVLERNKYISIIEKDREDRIQIINKLSDEVAAIQKDREDRLEIINKLTNETVVIQNDREARLEMINKLTQELQQLQQHQQGLYEQIRKLNGELEVLFKDHSDRLEIIIRQNNEIEAINTDRDNRLNIINLLSEKAKNQEVEIVQMKAINERFYSNPIVKLLASLGIISKKK
jgi:ubiquinone/menaquinone biosynthesis C-methylase UbiE